MHLSFSTSCFELYAGALTPRHKKDLEKILKWLEIVSLTREIAEQSAEIYKRLKRENKLIEFRDICPAPLSLCLFCQMWRPDPDFSDGS